MRGVILAARFCNLLGENTPEKQNPPKWRACGNLDDVAITRFPEIASRVKAEMMVSTNEVVCADFWPLSGGLSDQLERRIHAFSALSSESAIPLCWP